MADVFPWPDAEAVGGWWNRRFDPEVDLIGADRTPAARTVFYAGSVKWLDDPFDQRDFAALRQGAAQVPGFVPESSGLVVVSRAGTHGPVAADLVWGPGEVVGAWR